jgi:5-methylcytosine-specific restriction endonuclease McrA
MPPNAAWRQRDRHVCSSRCNGNLSRQFNRIIRDRGAELDFHGRAAGAPEPLANPRVSGPCTFRTLPGPVNRYESEGFGPVPGDIVERHGVRTAYALQNRDEDGPWPEEMGGHLLVATALDDRGQPVRLLVCGANPDGTVRRVLWGSAAPGGPVSLGDRSNFAVDATECTWELEIIRDATHDGRDFDWEAPVAVPVEAPYDHQYWTPARRKLSQRRQRASASRASHARRVRRPNATVESFDPHEVYNRDQWACGLCGEPVNPETRYPDPMCPSLDHVIPLVAGGDHSRANTQLAHWYCNVRKGASMK